LLEHHTSFVRLYVSSHWFTTIKFNHVEATFKCIKFHSLYYWCLYDSHVLYINTNLQCIGNICTFFIVYNCQEYIMYFWHCAVNMLLTVCIVVHSTAYFLCTIVFIAIAFQNTVLIFQCSSHSWALMLCQSTVKLLTVLHHLRLPAINHRPVG